MVKNHLIFKSFAKNLRRWSKIRTIGSHTSSCYSPYMYFIMLQSIHVLHHVPVHTCTSSCYSPYMYFIMLQSIHVGELYFIMLQSIHVGELYFTVCWNVSFTSAKSGTLFFKNQELQYQKNVIKIKVAFKF